MNRRGVRVPRPFLVVLSAQALTLRPDQFTSPRRIMLIPGTVTFDAPEEVDSTTWRAGTGGTSHPCGGGVRPRAGDWLSTGRWRERVADFTATAELSGTMAARVEYLERG